MSHFFCFLPHFWGKIFRIKIKRFGNLYNWATCCEWRVFLCPHSCLESSTGNSVWSTETKKNSMALEEWEPASLWALKRQTPIISEWVDFCLLPVLCKYDRGEGSAWEWLSCSGPASCWMLLFAMATVVLSLLLSTFWFADTGCHFSSNKAVNGISDWSFNMVSGSLTRAKECQISNDKLIYSKHSEHYFHSYGTQMMPSEASVCWMGCKRRRIWHTVIL